MFPTMYTFLYLSQYLSQYIYFLNLAMETQSRTEEFDLASNLSRDSLSPSRPLQTLYSSSPRFPSSPSMSLQSQTLNNSYSDNSRLSSRSLSISDSNRLSSAATNNASITPVKSTTPIQAKLSSYSSKQKIVDEFKNKRDDSIENRRENLNVSNY